MAERRVSASLPDMHLLVVEGWLGEAGIGLARALTRRRIPYTFMTRDPNIYRDTEGRLHPLVESAAQVLRTETNSSDEAVTRARRLDDEWRVDGVLTTCDYYLPTVALIARALGLPGESPSVALDSNRKDRVRGLLDEAGVTNLRWTTTRNTDEALDWVGAVGLPVVVKPADGNAGTGVTIAADPASVVSAVEPILVDIENSRGQNRVGMALLEEVLIGQEVSVEGYVHDGTTTVLAVTDKSLAGVVETGHMVPAALDASHRSVLTDYVGDVIEAIGMTHGLIHVEIAMTDRGPMLVEVNPRQGGGGIHQLVDAVTGVDPLDVLIDLSLGYVPQATTHGEFKSAAVMFLLSPEPANIVEIDGLEAVEHLRRDGVTIDVSLPALPVDPGAPIDNNSYLGRVTVRSGDHRARAIAEKLLQGFSLVTRDARRLKPLGFPSGMVDDITRETVHDGADTTLSDVVPPNPATPAIADDGVGSAS